MGLIAKAEAGEEEAMKLIAKAEEEGMGLVLFSREKKNTRT